MRNLMILSVLALAACGENSGWNPNYSGMHNGTGYAKYMHEREAALHGKGAVPPVIPVQLPAKAPTSPETNFLRRYQPYQSVLRACAAAPEAGARLNRLKRQTVRTAYSNRVRQVTRGRFWLSHA